MSAIKTTIPNKQYNSSRAARPALVSSALAGILMLGAAYPAAAQMQGPRDDGAMPAMPAAAIDAPAGTAGRIAKFKSATGLTNSVLREKDGAIGLGLIPTPLFGEAGSMQIKTLTGKNGFMHTDGVRTLGTFVGTANGLNGGFIGMQSPHPLQFGIAGSTHMTIGTDGHIGVGITPLAAHQFSVKATGSTNAIWGRSATGAAILGVTETGFAGQFIGDVEVTGTLTKGGGSFKIDHPLEPDRKYLSHSFVESPDMMNIYNGNVVLDGEGRARIELPGYFGALNRDFRYLLTPIGASGPHLHVAEEIDGNRFAVAGGRAGQKVSWQVTGIRQDAYANAHRIPNEEDKPATEVGTYLHPKAFGLPEEKGLDWARQHGTGKDTAGVDTTSARPQHAAARN